MSAEAITIVSGFVLLGVFVLVGWKARRKHARDEQTDGKRPSHDPR